MRKASPGTVIHGTLKTDDLLESFASELEHNIQRNAQAFASDALQAERNRLTALITEARGAIGADDVGGMASDIVDSLIDALQAFAPDGHYFGTHEGDGADFGYWPCDDFADGTAARHCCC
ncbi:MAG: hypothetical protein J2P55_00025 [Rhizobiales bacterium]|nr:hypothetical protein [Hyphomicrobiales bacterium]